MAAFQRCVVREEGGLSQKSVHEKIKDDWKWSLILKAPAGIVSTSAVYEKDKWNDYLEKKNDCFYGKSYVISLFNLVHKSSNSKPGSKSYFEFSVYTHF